MIRNYKSVVTAFLVVCALGAWGSTASAAEFHSEASSTEVRGEQAASFNDKFTVDAGTTECENGSGSGSVSGATTTTVSGTGSVSGCTSTFGVSVTVDSNGCQGIFHTGATNTGEISCPTGKVIEVTAPGCTVTIPPQTGLTGVTLSTQAGPPKYIKAGVDSTNQVKYEEHNKGFFPTCKTNTGGLKSNGSYTGSEVIKGFSGGTQVGIWWE